MENAVALLGVLIIVAVVATVGRVLWWIILGPPK